MNKDRKVVEYRRKPDGTYERVDPEPSMPSLVRTVMAKSTQKYYMRGNVSYCRGKS